MNVKCWAGDWGLPSFDIDSLSVLTYAYFADIPLNKINALPKNTITGILPELEENELIHSEPFNIISAFRREGYNADYGLTLDQSADTLAYLASIEQRLRPAILYTLWIDIANYEKVTRLAYGNACGLPWSMWYPNKLLQSVEEYIAQFRQIEPQEFPNISKRIYKEAQYCLNMFESRLGNSKFFFGDSPSTFDAILYGHLGILLHAPLVSTELQNHLHACERLKSFCLRIEKYFPEPVRPTYTTNSGPSKPPLLKKNQPKTYSFGIDIRLLILDSETNVDSGTIISIVVAVGAMAFYAFASGLLTSDGSKLAQKWKNYKTKSARDVRMEIEQLD